MRVETGQSGSVSSAEAAPPRVSTRAAALSAEEVDALAGIAGLLEELSE